MTTCSIYLLLLALNMFCVVGFSVETVSNSCYWQLTVWIAVHSGEKYSHVIFWPILHLVNVIMFCVLYTICIMCLIPPNFIWSHTPYTYQYLHIYRYIYNVSLMTILSHVILMYLPFSKTIKADGCWSFSRCKNSDLHLSQWITIPVLRNGESPPS